MKTILALGSAGGSFTLLHGGLSDQGQVGAGGREAATHEDRCSGVRSGKDPTQAERGGVGEAKGEVGWGARIRT